MENQREKNRKKKEIASRFFKKEITPKDKKLIDEAVKRVIEEYGETLRLLGKE